jgi:hypothetical protein
MHPSTPAVSDWSTSACFPCRFVLIIAVAGSLGCRSGDYYSVSGRILDPMGNPIDGLEDSQVVFSLENGLTSSVGEVQSDGSFEMFTDRPGDGVPPGEYHVLIARKYLDPERAAPQVIDSKYENFDTSGLRATVEPKDNVLEFKVERVKGRGAG